MRANVASQWIGAQMVSATDGSAFTGSVTVYVTGNNGTQAAGGTGSGACTHEGGGYHSYVPTQAETNYTHIAFTFTGSGAIPVTIQVYTYWDCNMVYYKGNSVPTADTSGYPKVTVKSGTGTGELNLSAGVVDANTTKWSGTAVAATDTAGYPKVTIKSGTGTGELDITSGVVKANATSIGSSSTAATRLGQFMGGVRRITVDDSTFSPTTTAVETSATVDEEDAYLNQAIFFESTGITRIVTAYAYTNSKVKLTFAELPAAPSNGAAIQIMGKYGNS